MKSKPICVPCLEQRHPLPRGATRTDHATSCNDSNCGLHETCAFCGGPTDGRRVKE